MGRFPKALAIILFRFNLCIGSIYAQIGDHCSNQKTQVVIIGTIHSFHCENYDYSPEKLKKIISSLKPAAILNELPLSLVDPNGRPVESIRDRSGSCPEIWAADEAAMELGVRQIPYDRPDRQENFKKTHQNSPGPAATGRTPHPTPRKKRSSTAQPGPALA